VSERCTELMTRMGRQLDEIAEFFGTLNDADLPKPCRDEGGDDPGKTVGAVAAHVAEGYHRLGQFLRSAGYVGQSRASETSHSDEHGHGRANSPEATPDLLNRLIAGKAPIGLLADLTDEQLDSVPAAGSSRFSDGHKTLEQIIDEVIAHQAAHLAALQRAVA
jgi:hypothetical protein